RCCHRVARIAAGSGSSSLPHPMPILILSRKRPSLRWERISVSHSIATAASPTAAKEPDKYRCLIGAMSADVQVFGCRHDDAIHALRRPASEKRQGTKLRE